MNGEYNRIIPIVFSSNNRFLPYISVTIQSIIENVDNDTDCNFFVLYGSELSENYMEMLNKQLNEFPRCSIKFIDVSKYTRDVDFQMPDALYKWSDEVFFKLLIPYIFNEYEKIIFLDGDIICCADINELYKIDIGGFPLAGVRNYSGIGWCYSERDKNSEPLYEIISKMDNPDDDINTGVLLFNCKEFRKMYTVNGILALAASRKWPIVDEDVLNIAFYKKIFCLPAKWNYYVTNIYAESFLSALPDGLKQEFDISRKVQSIVHFNHNTKPFNVFNIPHHELFWKYAVTSPFFPVILQNIQDSGKQNRNINEITEFVLRNIRRGQYFGKRFILRCIKAWIIMKLKKILNYKGGVK